MRTSIAMSYHVHNVAQICDARERFFVLVHCPEMFGVGIIKSVLYVEPVECTTYKSMEKNTGEKHRKMR